LKRGLTDFGKELLLLSAVDYCSKNHVIDLINLSAFDEMNSNLEHAEIQSRMEKLLCLDEFCVYLFKTTDVPVKDRLTDKDRIQIAYGLITAFFLSNFAPEKSLLRISTILLRNFLRLKKFLRTRIIDLKYRNICLHLSLNRKLYIVKSAAEFCLAYCV